MISCCARATGYFKRNCCNQAISLIDPGSRESWSMSVMGMLRQLPAAMLECPFNHKAETMRGVRTR